MSKRLVVAHTGPLNYLVLVQAIDVLPAIGLAVTGTLGILDLAAGQGLVELATVFARLKATNFRYPPAIMETMLVQHRKR